MLKLNKNQIEYILYHLNHHIDITSQLRTHMVFGEGHGSLSKKILFPLSENRLTTVKYVGTLPVLFPLSPNDSFYHIDDKNNLLFHDDLLKSAFYLLSGYQETIDFEGDEFGRFLYADSIQKQLDIAHIPLVNEYFLIIIEGLEHFCKTHNIPFRKKKMWKTHEWAFMLTHDVDRVDKYTINELKLKLKQLLNPKIRESGQWEKLKAVIIAAANLFTDKNPYWNFEWMKALENKYNFLSTWFFLPQGQKHSR